jgi:hypothetical protein
VYDGLRFDGVLVPNPDDIPYAADVGILPGKVGDNIVGYIRSADRCKTLVVTQALDGVKRIVHLKDRWADLDAKIGMREALRTVQSTNTDASQAISSTSSRLV